MKRLLIGAASFTRADVVVIDAGSSAACLSNPPVLQHCYREQSPLAGT